MTEQNNETYLNKPVNEADKDVNKTVIIFNAAPNSGKDVAAKMFIDYFGTGKQLAFKDRLYEDTSEHFNMTVEDLKEYHSDRNLKEEPTLMFPKYEEDSFKQYLLSFLYVIGVLINNKYLKSIGYYSSRQALIHVSEDLIKPEYGENYYGVKLVEQIEDSSEAFYFVSDGGYKEEATPLLDKGYRVYIAQLERSGATFEGDSRSLLNKDDFKEYSNIKFLTIDNNGSLDDLYETVKEISFDIVLNQVKEHYGGKENEYEIVHL